MITKDWFYENWGKTRRRFAWFPIPIGQYWVWWEYFDETLAGRTHGPFGDTNQWDYSYPSTCNSETFVRVKYSGGGFATSSAIDETMKAYLETQVDTI